jgi:hypothetical protein
MVELTDNDKAQIKDFLDESKRLSSFSEEAFLETSGVLPILSAHIIISKSFTFWSLTTLPLLK